MLEPALSRRRKGELSLLWRWCFVIRQFGLRGWLVAAIGTVATLVLVGIPTEIIDTPLFTRMTPVRLQDYLIWVTTGLLVGLIAGTFALPAARRGQGKVFSGGLLSFLAVGCPVCNKLVVLLLGTSGALTYFAPAQLYIGIASVALLAWTLHLRVQAVHRNCCDLPSPKGPLRADEVSAAKFGREQAG